MAKKIKDKEKKDFENFEKERENCENKAEKILFHGTWFEPTSRILTGLFRIGECNQHGRGLLH